MFTVNVHALSQSAVMDDASLKKALASLPVSVCYGEMGSSVKNADIHLIIYSATDVANGRLPQLVQWLSESRLFCLIPHGETIDETLLANFEDVIFWPCGVHELKTRLLRSVSSSAASESPDAQLLAEFAQLNLIGKSAKFVRNVQLIKRMASCHAAVLIQGETGTGKENAARAIHYLSNRREQGFVPVNCAAIPDELLESELFGYEKGAFTDAKQAQTGLVAFANRGTLFLDEVDSLTPKAQAALLRFLQTQEYRPLGAKQSLHADVRILAATNADLKALVAQKLFREDLYFRLNVLNIVMPPLRERLDDIAAIAGSLLSRFASEYQTTAKRLDRRGLQYLMRQSWPGNIRELENSLLRAFLLSPTAILQFDEPDTESSLSPISDLSSLTAGDVVEYFDSESLTSFQEAKANAINRFEASYLQQLMQITHGNVSAAARLAGKERRALGRLLQKYAIDKVQFQPVNS